jgi:hypothetical protein
MSKLIYGVVTEASEAREGCKCNFSYPKLYINIGDGETNDYIEELQNAYPIKYATFDILSEFKIPTPFGEYCEDTIEYKMITNTFYEAYTKSFYRQVESDHLSTCYSEWTCGDPHNVEYIRLNELAQMEGKRIILWID